MLGPELMGRIDIRSGFSTMTNARNTIGFALAVLVCATGAQGQGWQSQDVGATLPGSTNIVGGTITVRGDGNDIWGYADAFRFVYLLGDGNCEIMARVTAQQPTDNWAKAGVMIRQSLAAGSTHAFMCRTPANGMAWQNRLVTNGGSNNTNGGPNALPRWVYVQRTGNSFLGRYAADAGGRPGTWTQVTGAGPVSITMTDPVYVGLAVTSHNGGLLSQAVFDNIVSTGTRKAGAGIIIARREPPRSPVRPPSVLSRLYASLSPAVMGLPAKPSRQGWIDPRANRRWMHVR